MADMDWSDSEQVVNFFNDGDSVDEFEGLRPGDLIDFNGNNNILANRDFVDDIHNGWTRDDLDVNIAPFTGEAKFNIDMQTFEPLDSFQVVNLC